MKPENRESYNGWTNYETWNYKLWIDNDEDLHNYWVDEASNLTVVELADTLREQALCEAPMIRGTYGDILMAALRSINFHEIAEVLKNEVE